jgi:hypothetical protein
MICSPPRLDRKCEPEAAVDLRTVPGVGAEIVLTVDGELRRRRLFRAHEQAELSHAIANTLVRGEGLVLTMASVPAQSGREEPATILPMLTAAHRPIQRRSHGPQHQRP